MTKKFKIIPIKDYGIVVNKKIKPVVGDYYYDEDSEREWPVTKEMIEQLNEHNILYKLKNKIIYSIGKSLDGVPLIELAKPFTSDLSKKYITGKDTIAVDMRIGFDIGYEANTNKYSEEDMRKCFQSAIEGWYQTKGSYTAKFKGTENDYLQSLKKQVIPTEVELGMENFVEKTINYHKNIWVNNWQVKITNKKTNTIIAVNYKI